MTTFLIAADIILVILVVVLLFVKNKPGNTVFSSLEDIELIEFQQNLKGLIEQLHKMSENEIKDMETKKKEVEDAVASAEAKIKELKYLIDRNQLIRKSEYKSEISAGPLQAENLLFAEMKKPQVQAEPARKKAVPAKFVINDLQEETKTAAAATDENKVKNKYDHINSLIKNGLAVEEIAKVTGLSRGEIELIKNIKR